MPWKGIGVAVAVIVATLVLLGNANGLVADWAWFSTIGYVGIRQRRRGWGRLR